MNEKQCKCRVLERGTDEGNKKDTCGISAVEGSIDGTVFIWLSSEAKLGASAPLIGSSYDREIPKFYY